MQGDHVATLRFFGFVAGAGPAPEESPALSACTVGPEDSPVLSICAAEPDEEEGNEASVDPRIKRYKPPL